MESRARLNVSKTVVKSLEAANIDHVFLVPGKMIYPLLDAIDKSPSIRGIVCAHETSSAFMADGYARASRRFGVCVGISGPGTMNFVPGMASAHADRIPVLYIAGGVSSRAEGKGAFQDATLSGIFESGVVKSLVENVVELKNKDNLQAEMRRAMDGLDWMRRAQSFISIPVDVQQHDALPGQEGSRQPYDHGEFNTSGVPANHAALQALCDRFLLTSKRVAFLIGSRGNDPETAKALLDVAEKFCIPVATTLSGKGAFPEDHVLSLGVYGFAGHSRAVRVINSDELDVLVVFGSDLNQRDSMNWTEKLTAWKELIVFDDSFDAPAMGHVARSRVFSGIRASFRLLSKMDANRRADFHAVLERRRAWAVEVNRIPLYDDKFEHPGARDPNGDESLYTGDVVKQLCELLPKDANVVVDSGAHRIFMAHYWLSSGIGNYFSSSSLAPMGWAIAAGIGIKLAAPQRPCVVVTGDGCMLMHGMEIQTAARYNIKMLYIVLNNSAHGAVHIDAISKGSVPERFTRLPSHNWAAFATSLAVAARRVERLQDLADALSEASRFDGPFLIEVMTGVFPAPNRYYAECAAHP
ncbi:thiamine pyrophosphate-binding protein [Paraburkholderia phytofirmans]|uniref:Thiamine pyrophosphate protein domain protein TPP-binding n=1 Tax=Paraburkholderia phytofirmans (strain DSM 17436 / LMG 22146 / PsJN) TaxID=398527 RepID=B2TB69_PARPJ|nr:thiamine pyrophosphate-binding protein [Paraburkholderia phytofirmans]ACD20661.1 thiamine pyrophosphate protein domain protein TPP-binding [Paraburkholderia phytofirmans PsJN]